MNAFQLLKEDHKTVSGIFQQLEPTTERAEKTRSELFAKLNEELSIHAQTLLKELEPMPVGTEQWAAKCKVLQENVEHHVEEEEGEMFPKARQVLSADEIDQLGTRMEELKTQLKQQSKSAGV